MPVKPITVRFYRLRLADDDQNFTMAQLSAALGELQNRGTYLNYTSEGVDYILDQDRLYADREGFVVGVMVNNVKKNLARYDSELKRVAPYSNTEMPETRGNGNDVCFLIHPATNILAVESRENRTRHTKIIRWIERNLIGFDSTIYASAVINPNAMARFESMTRGVKARFKFAQIDPEAIARTIDEPSIRQVTDVGLDTNTDTLEIVISTSTDGVKGIRRDSLNMNTVRRIAHGLLATNADQDFSEAMELESLYIEGFLPNGDPVKIDLIENKLIQTIRVNVNESRIVSSFDAEAHILAISDLFRRLLPDVEAIYRVR